jgi:hypothetical protein
MKIRNIIITLVSAIALLISASTISFAKVVGDKIVLGAAVSFQKSDIFLIAAAFISFVLSVTLWFQGYKDEGLFVGLWVPSILSFGCYFKQMLKK